MKLVQMTSSLAVRFGDETAIRMIKDAGFDGFDFSMTNFNKEVLFGEGDGYIEYVKNLKKVSDEVGLPCLQAHAPQPLMRTREQIMPLVDMFLRSIEIAAMLDCKYLVIHPGSFLSAHENKEFYDKMLPFAEQKGVIIATENMYKWKDETETDTVPSACGTAKDFVEHMEVINHPNFTACMDIGHAEMSNCEGAPTIIRALGDKIGCLHVHDTDLVNDNHTMPFVGKINWVEVTKALKEVGYKGCFTYEADAFLKNFPDELMSDCLRLMERTGRYLISLIEN
ncbi:MAG: sugar phosphate isomerase/epimerase [Clostridia bacterium]|nr:sugar phosphate isomerase/epimerase [Clostridia bacterium]